MSMYHAELGRLWQTSRVSGAESTHERLCYIVKWYLRDHPDANAKETYLDAADLVHNGINHATRRHSYR